MLQRTLTALESASLGRLAAEDSIGLPRSALLSVSRIGHPSLIVLRTVRGARKDAPSQGLIHASFRPEGHFTGSGPHGDIILWALAARHALASCSLHQPSKQSTLSAPAGWRECCSRVPHTRARRTLPITRTNCELCRGGHRCVQRNNRAREPTQRRAHLSGAGMLSVCG